MRQQDAIDERQIRLGVEVLLLLSPNKIAGGNADRPQDLLGVSFSPRGNLRLLTAPPVLFLGVGLHQVRLGPLHRKVQSLEQMAHMPGMIAHAKFLMDDLGDNERQTN